ncbi:MAG: DUF2309 domain-containing protein [Pseudomonadota bacterium]
MNMRHVQFPGPILELVAAAESAVRQIPPAFPLTATVAVNPWLGQLEQSREETAYRMARTTGARIARPRAELAELVSDGRIHPDDLAKAAESLEMDIDALRAAIKTPSADPAPLPTIADLAAEATGTDWPDFVADRIGLWASTHYDQGQALWPAPGGSAFASWRAFATRDLTPGLFGLPGLPARAAALSDEPRMAFAMACEALALDAEAAPLYFHRLLATMEGWAQLIRGHGWVAERDGEDDGDAFALLTIRLLWEVALKEAYPDLALPWADLQAAYAAPATPTMDQRIDMALQGAADRSAERRLAATFAEPPAPRADARPAIQAAFCIDVRSEVFRRALESADEGVETIGFAGFFGLPVTHHAAASDIEEARSPVLLKPGLAADAKVAKPDDLAARIQARSVRAWNRFKMATVSAFAFVEAAGPLYVTKLVRDAMGLGAAPDTPPTPHLAMAPSDRVGAAAGVLRAMSLTSGFAPVVLIAGHGAHVTNAPFASALQCGACGGHAGDVNARILAALLNDADVRAGLVAEGIEIPEDTVFVAGLHDTVSDEITLYDVGAGTDVSRLRTALKDAAKIARTERAARLSRVDDPEAIPRRGADWAEIRPEWGLAGCHAFIAAPRSVTAGRDLRGRTFLHSYDWQADDGFGTLELILTAPVVVASWIALQYHGSTTAPDQFGAGDKLLHNVTGGIGVIEGSGGHLRVGLPWQSVHDGEGLQHEATRLAVVIAAPTDAIGDVLDKHDHVRALFANGWLSLHAMSAAGHLTHRYTPDGWVAL